MGRTRPTDSSIPQARPFVTWYFVRWRTFWVGRGARKRPGALPAGLEACGGGFWPSCVAKKDAAASEVPAISTAPKTNSKPSAAGSSWKGGARERREKSGAPVRERPILSGADFAPTWSECGDSNPFKIHIILCTAMLLYFCVQIRVHFFFKITVYHISHFILLRPHRMLVDCF